MHIFEIILICSVIFVVGFGVGVLALYMIKRLRSYVGVIKITRDEDRVLFSLELLEDPMILESMDEVVFKVESSNDNLDRR